jgi:hypothetical protein
LNKSVQKIDPVATADVRIRAPIKNIPVQGFAGRPQLVVKIAFDMPVRYRPRNNGLPSLRGRPGFSNEILADEFAAILLIVEEVDVLERKRLSGKQDPRRP